MSEWNDSTGKNFFPPLTALDVLNRNGRRIGALLAPVLSRWTTKLPYCLWQWNKPGHNPGSSREFWQQPIYITAELRPAGARRDSVTVGSEREASWLCLCSVLEQIELHQSTARSARQCSGAVFRVVVGFTIASALIRNVQKITCVSRPHGKRRWQVTRLATLTRLPVNEGVSN